MAIAYPPALEHRVHRTPIKEVAAHLREHLGPRITAYLAGLDNQKTLALWTSAKVQPREFAKMRLRAAFHAALLIDEAYDDETARSWFFGANSSLDGQAPAHVLRNATDPVGPQDVVAAARAFAGGGH